MNLRRILWRAALSGTLLSLAIPGVSVAGPPQGAACTPYTSTSTDRVGESRGCLNVGVRLSAAPALGQTARLDIEVRTTADNSGLSLDVQLPAGLEWVSAPSGLRPQSASSLVPADRGRVHHATGTAAVGKNSPLRLTGTVRAVAEGSAEIRAIATTVDTGDTDAGSVFLTVGARSSTFGIPVADSSRAATASGTATSAHPTLAYKPAVHTTRTVQSAGTACATGSWGYVDHEGVARVSANAQVKVWDIDAKGPADLLASGVTGADGSFLLCFDNTDSEGGGQDVYVQFATENPQWIIRNGRTRKSYLFETAVVRDVATGSTTDIGAFQPADPTLMRGVEAFDSLNAAWNWTPGECWDARDSTCRRGLVNWAPDSTDGTYYSLRDNAVHLAAEDGDVAILVLHEFGHEVMDDVYEDDFPPAPDCNPHYINRRSSTGCAWTEGFATWYGATVLGDPTFRWPGGASLDLEGPTWGTPNWDNGDEVEGRVLGAMIDLGDSANEPGDNCTEDPAGPMWNTILDHVSDTFDGYWADRAADGYDVGPAVLDCVYHNTIDYRV